MCGIAGGWALSGRQPVAADLDGMLREMVHRGPDDLGWGECTEGAIGMRRLSIIDVAGGHQPISNEDETVSVVMNGEIYNFAELRHEIEASRRHRFRTRSDTEVIVHLYEDAGVDMVARLAGMFAFALVDRRKQILILARDRFGEKPLFYTICEGVLWFASEVGALLKIPSVSRKVDAPAILLYLEEGLLPRPRTAFREIRELPPGHIMVVKGGRVTVAEWAGAVSAEGITCSFEEAAEQLRLVILAAVKRQMTADVPVGAFLSGGVDSSTIVAAMSRLGSGTVKTFTGRFEHAPYDESPVAREVASYLGTEHHEILIPNSGFALTDLFRIVKHVGQPFADSSAIPTFFVSQEIRKHVKVCLSGDGGDEMFAGYPLFQWIRRCDALGAVVPSAILKAGALAARGISSICGARLQWVRRAWRAAEVAAQPPAKRLRTVSRLFRDSELRDLMRKGHSIYGADQRLKPCGPLRSQTRLRQLMEARIEGSLSQDMLVKVDRMSMAASLEVRAPMLDSSVNSFAARLPDDWLIRAGVGKFILREAARPWLPPVVFEHPKSGFSIPLHMFQNQAYRAVCEELLLSDAIPLVREMFDRDALAGVVRRGLTQKRDTALRSVYNASHQLWALLNLAAWAEEFRVSP